MDILRFPSGEIGKMWLSGSSVLEGMETVILGKSKISTALSGRLRRLYAVKYVRCKNLEHIPAYLRGLNNLKHNDVVFFSWPEMPFTIATIGCVSNIF